MMTTTGTAMVGDATTGRTGAIGARRIETAIAIAIETGIVDGMIITVIVEEMSMTSIPTGEAGEVEAGMSAMTVATGMIATPKMIGGNGTENIARRPMSRPKTASTSS